MHEHDEQAFTNPHTHKHEHIVNTAYEYMVRLLSLLM